MDRVAPPGRGVEVALPGRGADVDGVALQSDISTLTSYQSISLLLLVSKVLERHFYNLIIYHLLTHNILTLVQWGLLEGRSTVTALIK